METALAEALQLGLEFTLIAQRDGTPTLAAMAQGRAFCLAHWVDRTAAAAPHGWALAIGTSGQWDQDADEAQAEADDVSYFPSDLAGMANYVPALERDAAPQRDNTSWRPAAYWNF